jgi:CHASE2 domain-containing sensor protein/serine phosphatase RsbU (regulator of sigma subunit)
LGAEGQRLAALLLVAMLTLSFLPDLAVFTVPRLALFDAYQKILPRERQSAPVVIVAIDEASLKARGQWPWPRSLIAQLLRRIAAAHPAAVGLDLLFPEPDRVSPDALLRSFPGADASLRKRVEALHSHDALLAAALAESPSVLGFAGTGSQTNATGNRQEGMSPPFLVRGGDLPDGIPVHAGALYSLGPLQKAAHGQGLMSADLSDGRVRRIPLLAHVDGHLAPSLTLEMLRIASGARGYKADMQDGVLTSVSAGDVTVPVSPDGQVWLYFTPHNPDRFVSADEVLSGRADPLLLADKLVLVGLTGIGLIDQQTSALGERMPGVEVHAQFLENLYDDQLPQRPRWLIHAERIALAVLGILFVLLIPRLRPLPTGLLFLVAAGLTLGVGMLLFHWKLILFDAAMPLLSASAVYAVLIAGKLTEADRQRRILEREQARAAGEMDAARRIQMGLLPSLTGDFHSDPRFSVSAVMEPAREVGGDFYDFFKPSEDHLIAMVGDVSGKGLPASMFMAITKVLVQNAALRGSSDLELLMGMAQSEVARNNPESLFVTVLAVLLNLRNGELQLCSAGHDAPYSFSPVQPHPVRLDAAGGPPLCVIDDFRFTSARHQMIPGEVLCLVTDGVSEAANPARALYGSPRIAALLERIGPATDMSRLVQSLHNDVRQFEAGVERFDDITILALRWNGQDS